MPIPNATTPAELPALPVRIRRAALTSVVLGGVLALLWLSAVPCGFARLTHHPCPGCGSTRACLALAHGDIAGVFRSNPFGPVMALLLAGLAAQAIASMLLRGDLGRVGEGRFGILLKRGVMVVAVGEVLLWIARFFGALGGPVPVW
jgi:hypothetical protein